MPYRWSGLAVSVASAGLLVIAGCGGTSGPAGPAPTSPGTAGSPSGTATPSGQTLPACASGSLRVTLGGRQGAAGTSYQVVDFENVGSAPCTLTGYPGVSFLDAAGAQMGSPAARASLGVQVSTVVLAPGGFAMASVALPNTANFPVARCQPGPFANVRVYPPNETTAVLLPLAGTVCTTDQGRTQVSPVRAGRG